MTPKKLKLLHLIRRTTQIWVVTRHQYGIFALVSQTSFRGETSGSFTKCRLFSQAVELGTTDKQIQLVVRAGSNPRLGRISSATLITWPSCLFVKLVTSGGCWCYFRLNFSVLNKKKLTVVVKCYQIELG